MLWVLSLGVTSILLDCSSALPPAHCQGSSLCLSQQDRGNVLVLQGRDFQPVCDDAWGKAEADVACRQAGFPRGALEATTKGQSQGTYIMDEVQCEGTETTLRDCLFNSRHDCGALEAAGAICDTASEVELVEGRNRMRDCYAADTSYSSGDQIGQEVTVSTVIQCQQRCVAADACVQFSYNPTAKYCRLYSASGKEFSSGSIGGPRACASSEMVAGLGLAQCGEGICLRGGVSAVEGNVFLGGSPVCDDDWGEREAEVACIQLNYTGARRYTTNSHFGLVPATFSLSRVRCEGSETELQSCQHRTGEDCDSGEGAGVTCDIRDLITIQKERTCFIADLAYRRLAPSGLVPEPMTETAEECRLVCQTTPGCTHFTWYFLRGKCDTFSFQVLPGKIPLQPQSLSRYATLL